MHQIALDEVDALYEILIFQDQWSAQKRQALSAQVSRRKGEYACFDNRATTGQVRFITNVPIPGAVPTDDIDTALYESLRGVDLPQDTEQNQRVYWCGSPKDGHSLPTSPKAR